MIGLSTLSASANLSFRAENFIYKLKTTGSEFGESLPADTIIYLNRKISIFFIMAILTVYTRLKKMMGYNGQHMVIETLILSLALLFLDAMPIYFSKYLARISPGDEKDRLLQRRSKMRGRI